MMKRILTVGLSAISLSAIGAQTPARVTIRVDNPLAISRRDETVSISWPDLQRRIAGSSADRIRVLDAEGREIPSQTVDDDGDGVLDALIFQGDFGSKETRRFTIEAAAPNERTSPESRCGTMVRATTWRGRATVPLSGSTARG